MKTLSAQLPADSEHNTRRLYYIDGLRGIAILGVVCTHAGYACRDILPDFALSITEYGARGVQLFFLLSALTLLSVYRERDFAAGPFFIRRFFRIAPMFYTAALFYRLLYGMGPSENAPHGLDWHHILLTLAFLHGWFFDGINSVVPGGWSIGNEAMFYALFPFLLAYLKTGRRIVVALVLSIALAKFSQLLVLHFFAGAVPEDLLGRYLVMFFPMQIPAFLGGFAVFYALRWIKAHPTHIFSSRRTQILSLAVSLLALAICAAGHHAVPLLENYWLGDLLFIPAVTAIAVLGPAMITSRALNFIGTVSYSIYIVHFVFVTQLVEPLVMPHLKAHGVSPLLQLGAVFACILLPAILTAAITYRFIEKPMIALGHRIAAERP